MYMCVYFPLLIEYNNTDVDNVLVSFQCHILPFRDQHVIIFVLFTRGQMLLFLVVRVAFDCSQTLQRVSVR